MASLSKSKRIFGLDLLRAFSIWLVLLQHAGLNIPGLKPIKIGGFGVEIFFVLSGFLIGGILFKELDKKAPFHTTLKNFWVRRWFRILPLYYLILFFKFIVIDHSIGSNILYYVFFLQNNFYGIEFLNVSWSLVIEEWFYLFAPIFLFVIYRLFKRDSYIIWAIVLFMIFEVLLRLYFVINFDTPYKGIHPNFILRFDSLFIGVLLAFLKNRDLPIFKKLQTPLIFIVGLAGFVGYLVFFWSMGNPVYLIDSTYFIRTVGFLLLPFFIGLTIPYLATIKMQGESRISKYANEMITWTSLLTYAIYLVHPFMFKYILHSDIIDVFILKLIMSLFATYTVAFLLYKYFENPILKYRDKITK